MILPRYFLVTYLPVISTYFEQLLCWILTTHNEPTHKHDNILDLLFINIPELIEGVTVMEYKEACFSDHFGIKFELKIYVKHKKIPIRKILVGRLKEF